MKKKPVKGIFSLILILVLIIVMLLPAYAADINAAETKAGALKKLGLFKGVSKQISTLTERLPVWKRW